MSSYLRLRMGSCFAAVMVLAAVAAVAPSASADDDDDDRPKKRRLIVTVDDNDDVNAGKTTKKSQGRAVPEAGASEAEINAYLRDLQKDVRETKTALGEAKRAGDADEALRLRDELRDKKTLLSDEESRLISNDPGLIAGGATLTALGGISLVSSIVLLFVWGGSALDGNPEDEFGWGSLGCLGGGVLGLSAGIPMIVAGKKRHARDPEEEAFHGGFDLATRGARPPAGFTFSVAF